MKRRLLTAAIAAGAALMALASPAFAHEEITPSTFSTGKPTFFALSAANEKKSDLTRIALTAPAGLPFGSTTRQPAGWTVDKSDTQITWTGGKVAPDDFEQWGFEIEGADQPGTLQYKVTMGFADGTSDDVEVDVTAVAAGTTATTVSPSSASTVAATAAPATKSSDSSDGLAVVALIVGLLAAVLGGAALAITMRGRASAGASAAPTGGKSGKSAEGQDW